MSRQTLSKIRNFSGQEIVSGGGGGGGGGGPFWGQDRKRPVQAGEDL